MEHKQYLWIWCAEQQLWSNGKTRITHEFILGRGSIVYLIECTDLRLPKHGFVIPSHREVAERVHPWQPKSLEEIMRILDGS